MSVDLSKLRIGDSIRLRNGRVKVVSKIDPLDSFGFYKWRTDFGYYYSNDGKYYPDKESPSDIVEIIPKEEKEEVMSVDLSKLRVGDSVRLRNGTKFDVRWIQPHMESFYKWSTNFGHYSNTGRRWKKRRQPEDIVEIIPKKKKEEAMNDTPSLITIYRQDPTPPPPEAVDIRIPVEWMAALDIFLGTAFSHHQAKEMLLGQNANMTEERAKYIADQIIPIYSPDSLPNTSFWNFIERVNREEIGIQVNYNTGEWEYTK